MYIGELSEEHITISVLSDTLFGYWQSLRHVQSVIRNDMIVLCPVKLSLLSSQRKEFIFFSPKEILFWLNTTYMDIFMISHDLKIYGFFFYFFSTCFQKQLCWLTDRSVKETLRFKCPSFPNENIWSKEEKNPCIYCNLLVCSTPLWTCPASFVPGSFPVLYSSS